MKYPYTLFLLLLMCPLILFSQDTTFTNKNNFGIRFGVVYNYKVIHYVPNLSLDLGQHNFYPNLPSFSDIGVIALSLMAESAAIDSENLLFSILKTDYREAFPGLPDRSRFNVRRRKFRGRIEELCKRIGMSMSKESTLIDLVDSVPIPVVKNSRERSYRICRELECLCWGSGNKCSKTNG
jgi:hypothetical protein